MVLDYLSVPDLIHCACLSKRMREMVYDDTRWVRRLQSMGCWDEAAARAKGNQAALQQAKRITPLMKHAIDEAEGGMNQSHLSRTKQPMDSSASAPKSLHMQELSQTIPTVNDQPADGFQEALAPGFKLGSQAIGTEESGTASLHVLSGVRSVRGSARQEYSRVHAALRPFYRDAIRNKNPSNAKIFRMYRDPNQQALMLAQILRFAASDSSLGQPSREEKLSAMTGAFEDAVSHEFEAGLKIGDVDGRMKKYANVLVTLNGGQRAISQFLAENTLLQDVSQLGNAMDCLSPTDPDILFTEEIFGFFARFTSAVNAQMQIISRVFPLSVDVASVFLDDVGRKVCVSYINNLLTVVQEKSTESYLRATSITYHHCLQLFKNLQFPSHSKAVCTNTLTNLINGTFSSYVAPYMNTELESFKLKADAEVNCWEKQLSQQDASIESLYMTNVNRQADKRDFLSSFRKVVMMPVTAFPFGTKAPVKPKSSMGSETLEPPQASSSRPISRTSSSFSINYKEPPRTPSPYSEAPSSELAAKAAIMKSRLEGIRSLFSLEVALNLVHVAKASIDRTAVFSYGGGHFEKEARSQCETIFILLLQILGNRHVRTGFDQAVGHLTNYDPQSITDRMGEGPQGLVPLLVFLELVNVGDLIQQMLDVFYEQELVATGLIDRNDFLSPTLKEKRRFEQMLDERVAAGLNKGIEVLIAEVEHICRSTQSPEDYNPDASGVSASPVVDVSPTPTAIRIVDLVSSHTKILVGSTDKNMLDVFNQEVGLRLFSTLCKHLKRQRISVSGSIRLIRYVRCCVLSFLNVTFLPSPAI